jgi:membrane AbrB-like protein
MLAGIVALVGACSVIGWLLMRVAHIDMLTAYFATSPGGADSIAIIAAGTSVDVPFVMATQMSRFVAVLLLGPALAKRASRLTPSAARASDDTV